MKTDNGKVKYYMNDASTVKPSEGVIDLIDTYLTHNWYNPSDINEDSIDARNDLEHARESVADFIGANPSEIVFTSSGTEANNLAIQGFINANEDCGDFITSSCEHPSIRNIADFYDDNNYLRVYWNNYDNDCTYDYDALDELIKNIRETYKYSYGDILVSIMMVNNETGIKNDIKKITEICHKYDRVFIHTDATHGLLDKINVKDLDVDLLTFSGHKLGVPSGVGVVYIKEGIKVSPIIYGGGQEEGYRSGTENLPYIAALPTGITDILLKHEYDKEKYNGTFYDLMKDKLLHNEEILKYCPEISINCDSTAEKCGHIISVCFKGYNNKELLAVLDSNDVICSAGSACSNHTNKPSRTLLNLGYDEDTINSTIRFSSITSAGVWIEYIDDVINKIAFSLKMLRK